MAFQSSKFSRLDASSAVGRFKRYDRNRAFLPASTRASLRSSLSFALNSGEMLVKGSPCG